MLRGDYFENVSGYIEIFILMFPILYISIHDYMATFTLRMRRSSTRILASARANETPTCTYVTKSRTPSVVAADCVPTSSRRVHCLHVPCLLFKHRFMTGFHCKSIIITSCQIIAKPLIGSSSTSTGYVHVAGLLLMPCAGKQEYGHISWGQILLCMQSFWI